MNMRGKRKPALSNHDEIREKSKARFFDTKLNGDLTLYGLFMAGYDSGYASGYSDGMRDTKKEVRNDDKP